MPSPAADELLVAAPHAPALAAHVQRASRLRTRVAAADASLDLLPFGAFVIGAGRRVMTMNRSAREIVAAGDGVTLRRERLRAAAATDDRLLQEALTRALAGERDAHTLALRRAHAERPLAAVVHPVPQHAALVFVSDPDRRPLPRVAELAAIYGFTPAEGALLRKLLEDRTVEEAARELDIAVSTARTQLRRLLQKSGTRRQSELVRLVLTGLPTLRRDAS